MGAELFGVYRRSEWLSEQLAAFLCLLLELLVLLHELFVLLESLNELFVLLDSLHELFILLDGLHELLVIHVEGDLAVSFEVFEEILVEIPSVPGDDGATFCPLLRPEVQLVALLIFQEESATDCGRAVG